MKAKRFIDLSILPKNYRKLDCNLKLTWFYLWNNCDEAGVYDIDEDLFEFENGFELNTDAILNAFNGLLDLLHDRILIKDFIRINSGNLKKDYNPHKAVFRSLSKNEVKLNLSSNQAYFKLVDKDKDEEEDEDKDEDVKFGKSENLLEFQTLKNVIEKEFTWKESICRNFKEVNQEFTPEVFDNFLEQFFKQIENDGDTDKSIKDTKKHFSRWLKIEIQKSNEQRINNKQTGATSDFRKKQAERLGIIQSP